MRISTVLLFVLTGPAFAADAAPRELLLPIDPNLPYAVGESVCVRRDGIEETCGRVREIREGKAVLEVRSVVPLPAQATEGAKKTVSPDAERTAKKAEPDYERVAGGDKASASLRRPAAKSRRGKRVPTAPPRRRSANPS